MLNHLHGKRAEGHTPGSMQGWGKSYDLIVRWMFLGQEAKYRQDTLRLASLQPTDRILEVGCGTGSLTLAAKKEAGPMSQIFGIDIAPDMIETARQKAIKANQEINFQVGRIENIPFPDGQFDLVLSSMMMHHVTGNTANQMGLAEVLRVLKPGGQLLIVDVEPPKNHLVTGLAALVVGREMLVHPVTELIPLMEQAGFAEIETGPTRSKFLSYLRGKRA